MFLSKLLQASRQSSVPNDVTTTRAGLNVVGFADRSALPQKFLKFCDTFPIYETLIEEMPLDTLNTSLSQTTGKKIIINYTITVKHLKFR